MNQEQLQEFINHPRRWPYRPMLPMKCYLDEGVIIGYMGEGRGLVIFDYDSHQPREEFASLEALYRAGWRID